MINRTCPLLFIIVALYAVQCKPESDTIEYFFVSDGPLYHLNKKCTKDMGYVSAAQVFNKDPQTYLLCSRCISEKQMKSIEDSVLVYRENRYYQVTLPSGSSRILSGKQVDRNKVWIKEHNATVSEINTVKITLPSGGSKTVGVDEYKSHIAWIEEHKATAEGYWVAPAN